MATIRSAVQTGTARRRLAVLGVFSVIVFYAQLTLAVPAAAAAFSGGFSPTIVNGLADLNGNAVVNGADDSNEFYGSTHVIDGRLDCDAWLLVPNAGLGGDGVINALDDCTLIGYDGTSDGVTIEVDNGVFLVADGPLPTVFNAVDPANPDVGASQFAWSTIGGRVDSNGDETIDQDDCHLGLIGQAIDAGLGNPTAGVAILGNDAGNTNPCGFAVPPADADDGLVDLNSDGVISAADSCARCFFGHRVISGVVQERECPGHAGDPQNQVVGTPGPDVLTGTAGADIMCGLGGNDTLHGGGGADLLLGGRGADLLRGGAGADTLVGSFGPDTLTGGTGPDRLFGGVGRDWLSGGFGNDLLFGGIGPDQLFGGPGSDHLDGGPGFDLGVGGLGTDTFIRCERQRP
jgi:Ca2+-binding RTX toxin-like protein